MPNQACPPDLTKPYDQRPADFASLHLAVSSSTTHSLAALGWSRPHLVKGEGLPMNNHHQVEILATRSRKVWYPEPHRGAVHLFSDMIPDARDLIPRCHFPTTKVVQNGLTAATLAPLLPAHVNIIVPSHYRCRSRDIQAMDLIFVAL